MTDIKKINEDLEYARYHCTSSKGKDSINDALDFINRQQAEIERLKGEREELNNCFECAKENCSQLYLANNTVKEKAIKEFAEKLKGKYLKQKGVFVGRLMYADEIDNLVKEMVGEE